MIKRIIIVGVLFFCFLFKASSMDSVPSVRFDMTEFYECPFHTLKKKLKKFVFALLCDDKIDLDGLDDVSLLSIFFSLLCGGDLEKYYGRYGR